MKISLSRKIEGQRGISNFMRELIEELESSYGVRIVDGNQKSDIHLSIISGHKAGAKNVVRLDGVYYDISRLSSNNSIKNAIRHSDGVVFQSNWCKRFATKMLGVTAKKDAIIYNGVNQDKFLTGTINKKGFHKIFVACAHWRVNKRLSSIINSFMRLDRLNEDGLGLFVIGNAGKEKIKHPNIFYYGEVGRKQVIDIYASSDYMVHICHIDACPNSVVEAMSSGLPVLCNNIGGTPEIVGGSGIILPLDRPFDFKPIKRMKDVRKVDLDVLTDGMQQMMDKEWKVYRPDLSIKKTAEQYYSFFGEILNE